MRQCALNCLAFGTANLFEIIYVMPQSFQVLGGLDNIHHNWIDYETVTCSEMQGHGVKSPPMFQKEKQCLNSKVVHLNNAQH